VKFRQEEIGRRFVHRLTEKKMILLHLSGDHPTKPDANQGILSYVETGLFGHVTHKTGTFYSFEFDKKWGN
jgi:hypothetical protein